jgi:hypothetical protein
MLPSSRESVIESLRLSIAQVEADYELAPDDPALIELKRIILNRIAEIESLRPSNESARIAAD